MNALIGWAAQLAPLGGCGELECHDNCDVQPGERATRSSSVEVRLITLKPHTPGFEAYAATRVDDLRGDRSILEAECFRVEAGQGGSARYVEWFGRASRRGDDSGDPPDSRTAFGAETHLLSAVASPTRTVCAGPVLYAYQPSRAPAAYAAAYQAHVSFAARTEYFSRAVRILASCSGFISAHFIEEANAPTLTTTITRWASAEAYADAADSRAAVDLHTKHLVLAAPGGGESARRPAADLGAGPRVWAA